MKKYGIFAFILSGLLLTATDALANCGDDSLDADEACDGTHFRDGKVTCDAWNPTMYASGPVSCNDKCEIVYDACVIDFCGNGNVDANKGEACDGDLFLNGIDSCDDWNPTKYQGGKLKCNGCKLDTSDCIPVPPPGCGDGKLDYSEKCDGDKFPSGQNSCKKIDSELYVSGTMMCSSTCEYDDSSCVKIPGCGNNQLDVTAPYNEVCDGTALGDATCASVLEDEWYVGDLACNADCGGFDTSGCVKAPGCGNGLIDRGETCDGLNHNNITCESIFGKWYKGTLVCQDNCHFDTSGCERIPGCGNKQIDDGEQCDGALMSENVSCESLLGKWYEGEVKCNASCGYDTSACTLKPGCGNGILERNEACDGTVFANTASCASVLGQWYEGSLTCTDKCNYDTSSCTRKAGCGNGVLDPGEDCEGDKFAEGISLSCSDWSELYETGKVRCNRDCEIDFSACREPDAPGCGNGIIDPGEPCDGALFDNNRYSCVEWDSKYVRGYVWCNHCSIDYSECVDKAHAYEAKNEDDDSGCVASPLRGAQNAAWLLALLGIALGITLRRSRKESK